MSIMTRTRAVSASRCGECGRGPRAGARLLLAAAALAAAGVASGATTVKWTGGGDGKTWSDTANWENGASVDFTKNNVYDLSAAAAGATLLNDVAKDIVGFILGEGQGTLTLTSSVTARKMSGTWTVPASTTFALRQAYEGPWTDYGSTTLTGGGTVQLAPDTFSANYVWTVKDATTLELAKGLTMAFVQLTLEGGSVLKVSADGTELGELDVDETSRVELGDHDLKVGGGWVTQYGGKRGTVRGAVTGSGSLVFNGAKTVSSSSSWDFTGDVTLKNASLAFADGCSFGGGGSRLS